MARIERYDNPSALDTKGIEALIANGDRPIVQFSRSVPDAMLRKVNALCQKHGDALEVRFYGFGHAGFDGSTLRKLPAVSALLVDCLRDMTHLEELGNLPRLRSLSLGIEGMNAPTILAMPSLRRLRSLSVGPTTKVAIDLSPIATMKELTTLTVSGQETSIEAIGECRRLKTLRLRMIGRGVRLRFVPRLKSLRSLHLALGGRDDIEELAHPSLTDLAVVRVRGLARVTPQIFPRLERLRIEDQLQIGGLELGRGNSRLAFLTVANCRKFRRLAGLRHLSSLRDLRIVRTPIELDDLLASGLPRSLRALVIHTGAARKDAAVRERLDGLGYSG
jgi:hypothetical protein